MDGVYGWRDTRRTARRRRGARSTGGGLRMTGIVVNRSSARRFAAVSALVAAPLAYLNIAIYLIVSGGDMSLLFDSARALTLSPSLIDLFRLGMVLDSFGFYLDRKSTRLNSSH